MDKQTFIAELRARLSGLPQQELEDRLSFYCEMIDDRIEDGNSEEDAISNIGSVETIAAEIISDIPLSKIAKERIKPKRRLRAAEIVLIAVGSPIWISLGAAAFAVILSLYATLWSLVVSIWAVFASFVACAPAAVVAGIVFVINGNTLSGIAVIGAGLILAGLAIFSFFGCRAATVGCARLTKNIILGIKKLFMGKGAAQ